MTASLPGGGLTVTDSLARETPERETVSVLVVDHEPDARRCLERTLRTRCALLKTAESIAMAEALRHQRRFDVMIIDIGLPGIEWLEQLRQHDHRSEVILTAARADLDLAIRALRAGASDFVLKPLRPPQIHRILDRCLERRRLARANDARRASIGHLPDMEGMVGTSTAMRDICDIVKRVAPTPSTVLVEGESGTGKELVARSVHRHSARRGPFVPVNCGAISAELLESELFGHTRGAFTGAAQAREGLFTFAHAGTLFLDEIAEMPLAMQAKLLRVLEERKVRPVGSDEEVPVDVRVIAATNRNLANEVAHGNFREDLYYRLNVVTITMPPLRERLADIGELARNISEKLSLELGFPGIPFSHEDLRCMQAYEWPGNVRELKNVIERCMLLGKLPGDCCGSTGGFQAASADSRGRGGYPLDWTLEQVHKQHMLRVLKSVGGNKSEAARRLGVSRKTMERKLRAWLQADR